jgi:Uma2 family endonuclease
MVSRAAKRMTLAAFLDWNGTERGYQLVGGRPVMMAPVSEAHGKLAAALILEIGSRLKRSYRVISNAGITVESRSGTCYVADLAATRALPVHGLRTVAKPVLIVEVLSPARRNVERVRKLADYRTLSSVQEILVAFHGERRLTLQRRTPEGWQVEDLTAQASITLGCCEAPIPLDALYRSPSGA